MLFDLYHIGYLIFAFSLIIGLLIIFKLKIKQEKHKNLILKIIAITTILLHISVLWVRFLKNGKVEISANFLFPIYFCNITMFCLLVLAFWKNKQSKFFKILATFTAYAGFFGGLVTLFYPESYLLSKYIFLWDTLKSLLSHTTMLLGCLYLFVGEFISIKVENTFSYFWGVLACAIIGLLTNLTFFLAGHPSPNSMYLISPAIPNAPITMGWWLAILTVLAIFIFTLIWEHFTLPSEKRWIKKVINCFRKKYDNIYRS